MTYQAQIEQAYEMARKGATRGMVKVFLRDNDVPEDQYDLDSIFRKASRQQARKVRAKGAIMILGGVTMCVLGGAIFFVAEELSAISLALIFGGLGMSGKGLVDFTTGLEG